MKNSHLIAIFTTTFGFILMSAESVLIKITSVSATTYSFYIGILIFLATNLFLIKKNIHTRIKIFSINYRIILFSGLLMGLSNLFFINAIKNTTVAFTAIIISTAPLFATLFAYLLYKEKPKKRVFIVSFFIFIGLLIIFSKQLNVGSSGSLLGDIFALLCTICYTLNFVVMSKHTTIDRFEVLAISGLFIAIISLFFIDSFFVDKNSLYVLLITGLLVSPLSRLFMLIGTKTLPSNEVALLSILETILAPLWAFIFINEDPEIYTLLGGTVILLALIFNSFFLLNASKGKII